MPAHEPPKPPSQGAGGSSEPSARLNRRMIPALLDDPEHSISIVRRLASSCGRDPSAGRSLGVVSFVAGPPEIQHQRTFTVTARALSSDLPRRP